jgi:hypothetical protein
LQTIPNKRINTIIYQAYFKTSPHTYFFIILFLGNKP